MFAGDPKRQELGKHKEEGKGCNYINKLSDIKIEVLKQLITQSVHTIAELCPIDNNE